MPLVDEWAPEGSGEDDKVMSMAQNMWRKLRFRRHLQTRLAAIEQQDEMIRKRRSRDYDRALKVIEEIESAVPNSITEENLVDKLGKIHAEHVKKTVPRKTTIVRTLGCPRFPTRWSAYSRRSFNSRLICLRSLNEPLAERELAFEERLDAKIDRDIKQLGQMKTMTIGLGKRTITAPDKPLKEIKM